MLWRRRWVGTTLKPIRSSCSNTRPSRTMAADRTLLAQLLLGQSRSAGDQDEVRSYAAIRSLLLEWQEPDGSWEAAGQLPSIKWSGEKEIHECTTMWSILALSKTDPRIISGSEPRARVSFLKNRSPGDNLTVAGSPLLIADRFDSPGRKDDLLASNWLQSSSRMEVGLGCRTISEAMPSPQDKPCIPWLLSAVVPMNRPWVGPWTTYYEPRARTGSWQTPQEAVNKRPRGLNVYTYWGTAGPRSVCFKPCHSFKRITLIQRSLSPPFIRRNAPSVWAYILSTLFPPDGYAR